MASPPGIHMGMLSPAHAAVVDEYLADLRARGRRACADGAAAGEGDGSLVWRLGPGGRLRDGRDGLVVGVDVGGTFTDCLMLDPATGAFSVAKVPSTPQDQSIGFMAGLRALQCDLARTQTRRARHDGGDQRRARAQGLALRAHHDEGLSRHPRARAPHAAAALRPHRRVRGADPARAAHRGARAHRCRRRDPRAARRSATLPRRLRTCARRASSRSRCISCTRTPTRTNEQRCLAIVRELWPNDHVSLGSELLPEIREFERGTVAALNAYVQPLISGYVGTPERAGCAKAASRASS